VRVITKAKLVAFWTQHPPAKAALQTWVQDVSGAIWSTPQDIKRQHASASFVASNRLVFNIKGNDYRLVVAIAYRYQAIYVKFVGTHAQYDAINAATVEPKT